VSDLEVDIDGLRAFSSAMKDIAAGLIAAPAWLNGDVGESTVDHAISSFESHWSDGRTQILKNMNSLIDIAGKAVDNFTKVDGDLDKTLRDSMEKK
jgi:hypothetical protein